MSELANFIKKVTANPFNLNVPAFFVKKMVNKLQRRLRSRFHLYPPSVYSAFKLIEHVENTKATGEKFALPHLVSSDAQFNPVLKLAVGALDSQGFPDWRMPFSDAEQANSLHRWGWLLHWSVEHREQQALPAHGLAFMNDWLDHMGLSDQGLPWESYNISERIANAILFLKINSSECPDTLRQSLLVMASQLAKKIEYHGALATGNHIINNARALYFAGQMLQAPRFSKLAKAILLHDLTNIVKKDGFSREGSSHYQFLLTRWLLEICWIAAQTEDHDMQTFLQPIVIQMLSCCWFFLVFDRADQDWKMPLIGDVSPDFQWQWLIDLPWAALALEFDATASRYPAPKSSGWGALFDKKNPEMPAPDFSQAPVFQAFPESGWYRLDWEALTFFWHVENTGSPRFASHGHCDIGSFCFFWQGRAIFVDPGRYNYSVNSKLGLYGLSAAAHNSLTIDDFEPFIYHQHNLYPDSYKKSNVQVTHHYDEEYFQLVIRHAGFSRIHGDKIIFQRTFLIYKTHLEIVDEIKGRGTHQLNAFFQCAPQLVVKQDEAANQLSLVDEAAQFSAQFSCHFLEENQSAQLEKGLMQREIAGWYFPNYGEKTPTTTIKYGLYGRLPSEIRYQLTWNKA